MAKQPGPRIDLNDGDPPVGPATTAAASGDGERRIVPKHRQCPLCYDGVNNGVGLVFATRGKKQYRKCDRCGHTYVTPTDPAEAVQVQRRDVELNER